MEPLEIGALPPIHRTAWESRPRREITIIDEEERRLRQDAFTVSSAAYLGKQQSEVNQVANTSQSTKYFN
jgi:hypothetical protein